MGRVLSQGEIDNMLQNMLKDSSVLPADSTSDDSAPTMSDSPPPAAFADFPHLNLPPVQLVQPAESAEPAVPASIAAFKAKLAAAKAAREAEAKNQQS